jgi:hypothetical protein
MKKLLSAMSIILGLGLATAQQTVPATKASTHQTVKTVKTAKPATVTTAKPADAPATVKMKKDGTPDKRYNANKNLKKDGTPDKRYKTNK